MTRAARHIGVVPCASGDAIRESRDRNLKEYAAFSACTKIDTPKAGNP